MTKLASSLLALLVATSAAADYDRRDTRKVGEELIETAFDSFTAPVGFKADRSLRAKFTSLRGSSYIECERVGNFGRQIESGKSPIDKSMWLLTREEMLSHVVHCFNDLPSRTLVRRTPLRPKPGTIKKVQIDTNTYGFLTQWLIWHQRLRVGTAEQYRMTIDCLAVAAADRMPGARPSQVTIQTTAHWPMSRSELEDAYADIDMDPDRVIDIEPNFTQFARFDTAIYFDEPRDKRVIESELTPRKGKSLTDETRVNEPTLKIARGLFERYLGAELPGQVAYCALASGLKVVGGASPEVGPKAPACPVNTAH